MKSIAIAALSLFTILASAGPASCSPKHHRSDDYGKGSCLSRGDAKELASAYARLVGAFNAKDLDYLSEDWIDSSQSISTFIGDPSVLPPVTFNKASFAAAQNRTAANPTPISLVGEPLLDCNKMALIWTSTFGAGNTVRGITVIEAKKDKKKPVMTRWDVEFNSLLWAVNQGGYYCLNLPPAAGGPKTNGNPTCGAAPTL